ncbi:MAG: glycosyltransferase family 61 protein [Pseudomonadota bacterium]
MDSKHLRGVPETDQTPGKIVEVGTVDLSPLKLKPVVPSQKIEATLVPDARVHMGSGLVTQADGKPVHASLYLNRQFYEAGNPITQEGLGLLPRASGSFAILHNVTWENHYHMLIQTAVSAWLLAKDRPALLECALLPPVRLGHRRLLRLAGIKRAIYFPKETSIAVDEAVLADTTYTRVSSRSGPVLRAFSRDITERFKPEPSPAGGKLYISRKDSARRRLVNEDTVETIFARNGFDIVTLEEKSLDEQVSLFHGAEVIVGPHGAGLANMVFCRRGTKVIELTPSAYLNPCFLDIARSLLHDFAMHVFETPTPEKRHMFDWSADLDHIAELAASLSG